ncbi:pirin family protein [Gordonia sp. TBRC 11910]|uniref:Pirin family protein n=1 Tax=Gordonia asplenii TaxID=2725283 RepID=A0A848KLX9_9ACTN|nr:pirin family protein [Gordonia asplenii]NMO00094.1 pirin family protein [Gordonia asplenii]
MSNLETAPVEMTCCPTAATDAAGLKVQLLTSRDVPLGGPRAMTVHRTLPQRDRSLIGGWCFADHYGPQDVSVGDVPGMDVPPHPHIGLQTVSWLFSGEIEHRDTNGVHAMVRPGELNLMTAGNGIAHTEVSTPQTTVLHGVQLWVALPADAAGTHRDFAHYVPVPVERVGVTARVFLGELFGSRSSVDTFSPLLGAELVVDAGASITLDVDPVFEHGILVDAGALRIDNATEPLDVARTEMAYIGLGAEAIELTNTADEPARLIVLGGEPLGEDIIMWWNFVGRTHEEIVAAREEWMARSERFGQVHGYEGDVQHLPAPVLPGTRLKSRENVPGNAREH